MKECTMCNEIKTYDHFHKAKGNKDGYKNYCRDCYKNKIYSYGEKEGTENRKPYIKTGWNDESGKKGFIKPPKPIIVIDGIEGKECNTCGEWKPLTRYYRFKRMHDGRNIYCKECDLAAKTKYFRTERGKNNSQRASGKRRSRLKNTKHIPYDRVAVLRRDKYTCQKCGIKVHDRKTGNWNTPDKAHLDHIISLEDGGEDRIENIQTLCRTCNLSKGAKSEGVVQLVLF